jgi:hypothetical protein
MNNLEIIEYRITQEYAIFSLRRWYYEEVNREVNIYSNPDIVINYLETLNFIFNNLY